VNLNRSEIMRVEVRVPEIIVNSQIVSNT